jgi:hypothetical protein
VFPARSDPPRADQLVSLPRSDAPRQPACEPTWPAGPALSAASARRERTRLNGIAFGLHLRRKNPPATNSLRIGAHPGSPVLVYFLLSHVSSLAQRPTFHSAHGNRIDQTALSKNRKEPKNSSAKSPNVPRELTRAAKKKKQQQTHQQASARDVLETNRASMHRQKCCCPWPSARGQEIKAMAVAFLAAQSRMNAVRQFREGLYESIPLALRKRREQHDRQFGPETYSPVVDRP